MLISGLAEGGAERVTVAFLRRAAERGRAVTLCTVSSRHDGSLAAELRRAGLRRIDLGARRLADPLAVARYLWHLGRERFDLVHAHGQDAWVLASLARRVTRIPLVLTRHVLVEPQQNRRQRWRARAALAAARRADAVVAVSRAAADTLAQAAGVPERRIRVIFNGIDVERFQRQELHCRREAIRAELGVGPQDRVLLVPAVLREGKGHEILLQAWPRVHATVPRTVLLIAGAGEREAELRRQAAGMGGTVRFLGHRDDMPELLVACDLVALASHTDALPTALIETGAAGRPAVATRVGGVPEVVQHDRTGLLVPAGDARALAEALEELLLRPERAAAMGAAAAKLVAGRFSLDAQVDATIDLWQRLRFQGAL